MTGAAGPVWRCLLKEGAQTVGEMEAMNTFRVIYYGSLIFATSLAISAIANA